MPGNHQDSTLRDRVIIGIDCACNPDNIGLACGRWEEGGFCRLRQSWTDMAGPLGKPLTVRDGDMKKTGTLAGFGEHGELLLETAAGIEPIWSADLST